MATALILGAAVWPNGQPSPALMRRTRHAAQLYHQGRIDSIICCGGLGRHGPTEAEVMAQVLRADNIPAEVIAMEDRSTTTWENIAYARAFLKPQAKIVLVTDSYHAPRARLIAWALGLQASSESVTIRLMPKAKLLWAVTREAAALLKTLLRIGTGIFRNKN